MIVESAGDTGDVLILRLLENITNTSDWLGFFLLSNHCQSVEENLTIFDELI
jgi:hypothetical protein